MHIMLPLWTGLSLALTIVGVTFAVAVVAVYVYEQGRHGS